MSDPDYNYCVMLSSYLLHCFPFTAINSINCRCYVLPNRFLSFICDLVCKLGLQNNLEIKNDQYFKHIFNLKAFNNLTVLTLSCYYMPIHLSISLLKYFARSNFFLIWLKLAPESKSWIFLDILIVKNFGLKYGSSQGQDIDLDLNLGWVKSWTQALVQENQSWLVVSLPICHGPSKSSPPIGIGVTI